MPASATPEISVSEAEMRLGIASRAEKDVRPVPQDREASREESREAGQAATVLPIHPADPSASLQEHVQGSLQDSKSKSNTSSLPASVPATLPASLLTRKVKQVTVSRTFRLPLELANELEEVSALHDIPMVTILAEALQIHLARFPRQKTTS